MTTADVTAISLSPTQARARLDEIIDVYREAFLDKFEPDPVGAARGRRVSVGAHLQREDVRFVGFADNEGKLVAIAYGMPSRRSTWWHDTVRAGLPPNLRVWLDNAFEVSEVHVRPAWQGRGLGRALMDMLLEDIPQRTVVLSALADPTLPARYLYAKLGFVPLAEPFRFPGAPVQYAILGLALTAPDPTDVPELPRPRWWRR